jgi:colicin import membrane protein
VINVSLVALPDRAARPGPAREKKAPVSKPKTSKKKAALEKKRVTVKKKPESKKPVVSTSTKPKVSLKKKTFKSAKVKRNALEKIEEKVEKESSEQLATTLDQLKAKVKARENEGRLPIEEKLEQPTPSTGAGGDDRGGRIGELIDIYRVEIAYQIQKNWAFPSQLAGGRKDLQTMLVFKVMPNGEIKDLFFTDRSGNLNFDESAYRAVMKSNPVEPHPAGLIRPYVQMGLRFTPEGVK